MARDTADGGSDEALSGEQLRQLAEARDHKRGRRNCNLHERIFETLHAEDVQGVNLNLDKCEVLVKTDTVQLWGHVDNVGGRIKYAMVKTKDGEIIAENVPGEMISQFTEFREEVEAARQRRETNVSTETSTRNRMKTR